MISALSLTLRVICFLDMYYAGPREHVSYLAQLQRSDDRIRVFRAVTCHVFPKSHYTRLILLRLGTMCANQVSINVLMSLRHLTSPPLPSGIFFFQLLDNPFFKFSTKLLNIMYTLPVH